MPSKLKYPQLELVVDADFADQDKPAISAKDESIISARWRKVLRRTKKLNLGRQLKSCKGTKVIA